MSPLTKALVLLVTVLSIVLVALVVPFVANTDNLKEQISALETQKAGAELSAKKAAADLASLQNDEDVTQSELENRIETLLGNKSTLTATKADLEGQLNDTKANVDKLSASLALMTNTQEQLTALLDQSTGSLETAQSSNVQLKRDNAQLAQRNEELDGQVTGLTRTVRLQAEKITELQEEVLASAGAAAGTQARGSRPAPIGPEVRGAVTGRQQIQDIVLISINIGANDQVTEGTQLTVFRGENEYVGRATVMSVDETVSVARVESKQQDIRRGDGVITGIRF